MLSTAWSPDLAYAVGLLAADGCLISDQHLIDFTSVDLEQVRNYKKCLGLHDIKIGQKTSGRGDMAYRVQFKSAAFYAWLESIGLAPNKSKTLNELRIPKEYFFDFLRGLFDGDGSTYSYFDPRWKSSFMFYLNFTSASSEFLLWLQSKLQQYMRVKGHIVSSARSQTLRFAKVEASKIIEKMYHSPTVVCLKRKKEKIEKTFRTNDLNNKKRAGGETW